MPPRLRSGSSWLPLSLKSHTEATGTDALGSFKRVDFVWDAASTSFLTSVRVYEVTGVVVFAQNFTQTITSDGKVGSDSPQSWWPAFNLGAAAPELGYLGFSGCMSGGADVGAFRPASPARTEETAIARSTSNLSLKPCEANQTSQLWKFLAMSGEGEAAACSPGAKECLVENEGSQKCLQISHCSTADGASISADVSCSKCGRSLSP